MDTRTIQKKIAFVFKDIESLVLIEKTRRIFDVGKDDFFKS